MVSARWLFFFAVVSSTQAQIAQFPYSQNFDSVTAPVLPAGWISSQNRTPGSDDFVTSTSSPRSSPNAVRSTNGRISQRFITPQFDFRGRTVDSVIFFERRSSTYTSGIVLEASTDGEITFGVPISDTLRLVAASVYVRRAFPLPSILSNRDSVKIRWNVVGEATAGSTATLSFDDILITTLIQIDVGINSIAFFPPFPLVGDSVTVSATVENFGVRAVSDIPVEFYEDINRDSIPQPVELIGSVAVTSMIAPGDSAVVSFLIEDISQGEKQIIVRSALPNDENPANDRRVARIATGVPPFSVVVNEIMYAPTSPEPEWVELTNVSPDSINLRGWRISDINTGSRATITASDYFLQPNQFVVVAKDSARLNSIHSTIPARIFHVPTLATLNNDSDAVVLFDQRGMTMDSVRYRSSWGGSSGRSLERIDARGSSNHRSNWGSSKHPARSTPGRKNSLTAKDFDAAIDTVIFLPNLPIVGDSVQIVAVVRNRGLLPAQDLLVQFFEDADRDSVTHDEDLFHTETIPSLAPGDSITLAALRPSLSVGEHLFIVRMTFSADEDTTNNMRIAAVIAGYLPGTIVINEIMYGPTSGEPEWVEFFNPSRIPVNLKNWKVSNRNSASRYAITSTDVFFEPEDYVVVTKDTALLFAAHRSIPGTVLQATSMPTFLFSNNGDAVVLFDSRNAVMDSVMYATSWGGTSGRSLERVEATGPSNQQTNWGSSKHPARSTAGRKNSLTPKLYDGAIERIAITPAAPVAEDSLDIIAVVKNRGLSSAENLRIEFYQDANRDSLAQPDEFFQADSIQFLSPGDSLFVRVSYSPSAFGEHRFIVHLVFPLDEDTTNNWRTASVVVGHRVGSLVINEIMYAPTGGEPEWVELFNPSADSVNVKNWKIGNRNSSSRYTITATEAIVEPQGFLIVTKDTALFTAVHMAVPSRVIQAPSMPTFLFNNTGDAVVLVDARSVVMDSVHYAPSWGGTNGRSIERIDAYAASNDSTNWGSSREPGGSTPGRTNSITRLEIDLRANRIVADSSMVDEILRVGVIVSNAGRQSVSGFMVSLFQDVDGDSTPSPSELVAVQNVTAPLPPRDSILIHFNWNNPGFGYKRLIGVVEHDGDMRPSNNVVFGAAKVSYPFQSLVINEVMYAPRTGEAEYVELYNRSNMAVDVRDWKISDMRDATGKANEFFLHKNPYTVAPGEYFLLASDSSLLTRFNLVTDSTAGYHIAIMNRSSLSLNNNGDDVLLRDLTGAVIDSIRYFPSWHNSQVADVSGRSLERIHPELPSNDRRNWSTSTHPLGGTPARQNSIFTVSIPNSASLSFSPNPFSPDGDGHEDFAMISYEVPATAALLRIRIYDAKGRLIRTLANSEPTGARGSLVWDGMNENREKVRMGIYIVLLEALDAGGGTVHSAKGVIVVAARL